MREEIGWRGLAGEILGAGKRLNQRANVCNKCGIVAIEESLYIGQIGIEGEVRCWCEREQRVLGEREVTADGGVVSVPGGVKGNERVVGVIASEQKYADQRFVIGGALGESIERAEWPQAEDVPGGRQACAFDEGSSVCTHCDLP